MLFRSKELIELYAQRWDQELYYRELKAGMMSGDLLQSQTLETACQEVAAMIIGSSLIAEERAKIQAGQPMEKRVSMMKTWAYMEPLWLALIAGAEILSSEQKQQLADKFRELIATMSVDKKRSRSNPRVVRQPVKGWPRKRAQKSHEGQLHVTISRA